nr:ubiquitin hydrolase [Tanacetum cinerariifolium]
MAKSSSSSDNEVYDDSYCSKSCRKNTKNLNTKISKLNEELSDCETDLYNYKKGLSQVNARLVEFKEHEVKYCERIRVLERDVEIIKLNILRMSLSSSPPPVQIYSPPKKDLSWTGLPEFVDDTVTDYSRPTPSINASKCKKSELQSSNFSVFEHGEASDSIMSKPMIKFVKEADCPRVIKTINTENGMKSTVKYAEMYRNISKGPKVRGNQRNWNNLKSQQLGKDFLMQNKACFKCGYFDHLASNCGV